MPVINDESFEIDTVELEGHIYVKVDDLIAWLKDCRDNGMNDDTSHWLLTSLISCKNGIRNDRK